MKINCFLRASVSLWLIFVFVFIFGFLVFWLRYLSRNMKPIIKNLNLLALLITAAMLINGCGNVLDKTSDEKIAPANSTEATSFSTTVSDLDTPQKVYSWMQQNFTYNADVTSADEFRDPQTTFNLKSGDCDDYARFADYVLKQHGYKSDVMSVYNSKQGHSVCVWADANGKLNYLSNNSYVVLTADDLAAVAKSIYADWKIYAIYPNQEGVLRSASR